MISLAGRQIAHGAQRIHRHRQRKLFAEEAVDEAAAANFAAIFEAAEGDQQLTPLGQVGFARKHFAEHDAVALQQHPAGGFERAPFRRSASPVYSSDQRPAAVTRARQRGRCRVRERRLGSISERRLSKPSAVTRPAATSSHSAVSTSAFSLPVPRTMSAKNDAPRWRRNSSTCRASVAQATRFRLLGARMLGRHPVGFFANEESDGRDAGGNHAALAFGRIFERCRMRRETSPAHGSGEAKLVEPFGIVVGDAPRQHLPLPCIRRNFKALQLPHHFERAALAAHLRTAARHAASATASA